MNRHGALAVGITMLAAAGLWQARPVAGADAPALVAQPIGTSPAASPAAPSTADPPVEARLAAARRGARINVARSTAADGWIAIVRQQAFAPRVDVATEVWSGFLASRAESPQAQFEVLGDRLARVGVECEHRWAAGPTDVEVPELAEPGLRRHVVWLSGDSVGLAPLSAGRDTQVATVGIGTVDAGRPGAVWVWARGPFPGPHRADSAAPVPSGELTALVVAASESPEVAWAEPILCPPGGRVCLVFAPARALQLVEGSAAGALLARPRGFPEEVVAILRPSRAFELVEWGRPSGVYRVATAVAGGPTVSR